MDDEGDEGHDGETEEEGRGRGCHRRQSEESWLAGWAGRDMVYKRQGLGEASMIPDGRVNARRRDMTCFGDTYTCE